MFATALSASRLTPPKMSKEQGLQFKPFLPRLVEALEDADGVVRETAKMAVVELFRYAPTTIPLIHLI